MRGRWSSGYVSVTPMRLGEDDPSQMDDLAEPLFQQ